MDTPASYLNIGFVSISYPNLAVIALMILIFALALVAPFGHEGDEGRPRR